MSVAKVSIDGQVYEFDRDWLRNKQYMQIEDKTGMTAAEWETAAVNGSVRAMTAFVWMVLRFNGQDELEFEDVDFDPHSIEVEDAEESGKDPEPEAPSPTS